MIEEKHREIQQYFQKHSDPEIIKKYSRYFKGGFVGYGIDQKVFEKQRDKWIADWKGDMSLDNYLDLGDKLMKEKMYEEKSLAISFLQSEINNFSPATVDRIEKWFDTGIDNWATTDVLCILVLSELMKDRIIPYSKLKTWNFSDSEWQRRAVPVTMFLLVKSGLQPSEALPVIEPLMEDPSIYVQKGVGTLLRELWKRYPENIEAFLFKHKDTCGRSIVQYATEKMDKDYRKKFRKAKTTT